MTELVPFTESVFRMAADIRARHKFRTPDALHLAAAVVAGCDIFLTNDAGLKGFPQITVERLQASGMNLYLDDDSAKTALVMLLKKAGHQVAMCFRVASPCFGFQGR